MALGRAIPAGQQETGGSWEPAAVNGLIKVHSLLSCLWGGQPVTEKFSEVNEMLTCQFVEWPCIEFLICQVLECRRCSHISSSNSECSSNQLLPCGCSVTGSDRLGGNHNAGNGCGSTITPPENGLPLLGLPIFWGERSPHNHSLNRQHHSSGC